MKRLLILVFPCISLFACKKNDNDKTCYRCAFEASPAGQRPPLDTCAEANPSTFKFYDAAGNSLGYQCTKQ